MLIQKGGCTYILTNRHLTIFYTGVTSNLRQRILDHKNKVYPNSFTAKYNCDILIWYESFSHISQAILREKQIKAGSRLKKIQLIHSLNPAWADLWEKEVQHW